MEQKRHAGSERDTRTLASTRLPTQSILCPLPRYLSRSSARAGFPPRKEQRSRSLYDTRVNLDSFGVNSITCKPSPASPSIAHDGSLLVADDGIHTIQKFTTDGSQLLELGHRNAPAEKWSGAPFNRPTSAAIWPHNGDGYVSDGYGNSRIHVYTGAGEYKFSWGRPGIDAGQFIRPHNIAIDEDDHIYVVDREAHRIQIFDPQGTFITMWNNIHRPDAMVLWGEHIYVGELNGMGGVDDAPGLGHRVSIYDLKGNLVCRFGAEEEGEGLGQFIAPHGIAVDSQGDIYVAEVSYSIRGRQLEPPRELRSVSKYRRVS